MGNQAYSTILPATINSTIIGNYSGSKNFRVDKTVTVNGTINMPANKLIESPVRGGKIIKGTSGKINFLGVGMADFDHDLPIFEGFSAEDITWDAAAQPPRRVSTEWWKPATDASLIQRLNLADKAIPLGMNTCIEASPRTIDGQVLLRYGRKFLFKKGEYANTWAGSPTAGVSTWRRDPFTYNCPEDEWIVLEFEPGCIINLSATIDNAGLIYPSDDGGELNKGGRVYIYGNGAIIRGVANTANSGGLTAIRTGNCQESVVKDFIYEYVQDYHVTTGGDPRNGDYGENITVRNIRAKNCWNYFLHDLNGVNMTWEDIVCEIDDLDADLTGAMYDREPNVTEENGGKSTLRRVFFKTNQGTADAGAGRPYHLTYSICFTSQGAASDGLENQSWIDCGFECLPLDIRGVQTGGYAQGWFNGKIENFSADGGTANYILWLDNCRKVEIINPTAINGYSGEIRLRGCSYMTVIIQENAVTNPDRLKITEMEWGHAIAVNGTSVKGLDDWTSNYSRFYRHFIGLTFDVNGTLNEVTDYANVATVSSYPHKSLTLGTTIGGTKTAITMSSVAGNVATNASHGLYTGEPVDYSSSGTPITSLASYPYAGLPATAPRRLYAIRLTANTYSLATSIANAIAGTAIALTGGTGTHTLQPFYLTARSVAPADVDLTNNRVPFVGHNMAAGAPVQYRNYSGTTIGGLTPEGGNVNSETWFGYYWAIPDGADHIKFAATKELALAGTAIDLTSQGTGTHYIAPIAMTTGNGTNRYILPESYTVDRRHPSDSKVIYPFGSGEGNMTNFALDGTATASSTDADNWQASRAIDGHRHSNSQWDSDTGAGKAWKSAAAISSGAQWLEVDLGTLRPVSKINVFFPVNTGYSNTDPDTTVTGVNYMSTAYEIQAWYGGEWATVASETDNDKVRKEYTLSVPLYTNKVRIYITATEFSSAIAAYVNELEVWG